MATGMNPRKLELRPHDAEWKNEFELERARIIAICDDYSPRIEHIGSTAIPGIHAKPILDLAIICGEKGLGQLANALEDLGYGYRGEFEPDEPDHFYAVFEKDGFRYCQAHIYESETRDFRLKLAFRDALRRDRKLANEYNDFKLQLAGKVSDKSEYARIKDEWVSRFIPRFL